jgi:hypothetical protein
MKVRMSALQMDSGKVFFKQKAFTGTALEFREYVLASAKKFKEGLPVEYLENDYLEIPEEFIAIDADALTPVDYVEPAILNGEYFTGISYFFRDDFCWSESFFIDGNIDSYVGYFASGAMSRLELGSGLLRQNHQWYEDGSVKSFIFSGKTGFHAEMQFDEIGRIQSAQIDGNYFDEIMDFVGEIKFNLLELGDLQKFGGCSERLFLTGDGIDDRVFEMLTGGDKLNGTSIVELYKTTATRRSLTRLLKCKSVQKLVVKTPTISADDCDWFRSQRPDCMVEFSIPE